MVSSVVTLRKRGERRATCRPSPATVCRGSSDAGACPARRDHAAHSPSRWARSAWGESARGDRSGFGAVIGDDFGTAPGPARGPRGAGRRAGAAHRSEAGRVPRRARGNLPPRGACAERPRSTRLPRGTSVHQCRCHRDRVRPPAAANPVRRAQREQRFRCRSACLARIGCRSDGTEISNPSSPV